METKGKVKKSLATIDHMICKLDNRRKNLPPNERRLFLACYECNQRKCVEEQRCVPLIKKWSSARNRRAVTFQFCYKITLDFFYRIYYGYNFHRLVKRYYKRVEKHSTLSLDFSI